MSNQLATTKAYFSAPGVQKKFEELLGKRAPQFITSVLQIVNSNELLATADPASIYSAACVAATMDLPLNNNLGFAYIVPYNGKGGCKAQFQMGYKGFIQLAQRSGQVHKISATPVYEGQIVKADPLRGYEYDFSKTSGNIIGYAAYLRLVNGFEADLFMTVDELTSHGKKYSQSFKKGFGLWADNFEAMALKTVIKLLLSKFAPMSIEYIHNAVKYDQAVIAEDGEAVEYIDSTDKEWPEFDRAILMIQQADTVAKLDALTKQFSPDVLKAVQPDVDTRRNELEAQK